MGGRLQSAAVGQEPAGGSRCDGQGQAQGGLCLITVAEMHVYGTLGSMRLGHWAVPGGAQLDDFSVLCLCEGLGWKTSLLSVCVTCPVQCF